MDDLWSGLTLDMLRHRVVTLVGGGGKTTTLYALARRRIDPKYEGYVHMAGLAALLCLSAVVMMSDIGRLLGR